MLSFFTYKAEKKLAAELAIQIAEAIKPVLMKERRQVLSANKISRHLEHAFNTAKEYQSTHRIGVIRRAVLANAFKWELKNLGYPDDFIDVATEGLVVELSRNKK